MKHFGKTLRDVWQEFIAVVDESHLTIKDQFKYQLMLWDEHLHQQYDIYPL